MTAASEPRCERTDLYVSQCGHCRGHVAPGEEMTADREALLASGSWFPARYAGRCSSCGEWFRDATPIRRDEAGSGWIADCCAEGVEE